MSAVFISHSSKDVAAALTVRRWLSTKGHRSVFLDFDPEYGIPVGRDWEQELYQKIRSCRAVIVLCSRNWVESKWCFAELTQARSLGKAVMPVRIDDCVIDGVISDRQVCDMTGDDTEAFERLWSGLLAAGIDPVDQFDWDGSRAPYPGLMSFQEEDAAVFFGRADEIGAGLDQLNRVRRLGAAGFMVVMGVSGSGKSSLLRAGLVPRLRRDPTRWLVVDPFRPHDDPVRELASVLSGSFVALGDARDRGSIHDEIHSALGSTDPTLPNPLVEMAHELRLLTNQADPKVLFVVDQFEELLGFPPEHPSTAVLRLLRAAADAPRSPLAIVATLRSDFLGAFQNSPALLDVRYESLPTGRLSAGDIAQIIEQPAKVAGVDLQPGLVQAMVDDSDGGDALPLLAFTLRELFDHYGHDGRLDIDEYRDRLGGLHGAIARVADELVEAAQLSSDDADDLRVAFLAMVRLTEDDRWVRRAARWDDLPVSIHPIIERFVAARLLVSGWNEDTRTIEVAHEALFRTWGRLVAWLNQSTEMLRLQRDVQISSRSWHTGGEDPADLWRGARLAHAVELAARGDFPLAPLDREFIEASRDAEHAKAQEDARRRSRRLRAAVAVAVLTSLLAAVAVVFFVRATDESDRADRQARQVTAVALARAAEELRDENPALALALAAESSSIAPDPVPQATDALIRARVSFSRQSGQQVGPPLTGHSGSVFGAVFSPGGELLVSASIDGTVRIWDPTTGAPVGAPVTFHDGSVQGGLLSPGGERVIFAERDGTVRLWDRATRRIVEGSLDLKDDERTSVAFSPDGALLAIVTEDRIAQVWDAAAAEPVGEPFDIGHDVFSTAFSRDGTLLVTVADDETVSLWNPVTGEQAYEPLASSDDRQTFVGFGPEGHLLAFSANDGVVQLWDPSTGDPVGDPLVQGGGFFSHIVFSPDGTRLATVDDESDLIHVWDPATGDELGDPLAHSGFTGELAFSPGGTRLATVGDDHIVRLWELSVGDPLGQPLPGSDEISTYGVAYAPDGKLLATADIDGNVRLWDPTTGRPVGELPPQSGGLTSVAFSPDGKRLAVASADGSVRLWDPVTRAPIGESLTGSNEVPVSAVAFSPDGKLVAAAIADGTVRLWDPSTGERVGEPLSGPSDLIARSGLAFSPDGNLLAAAGANNTVRLWDPVSGEQVGQPLTGHNDLVEAIAFSPEGDRLASASHDGTVRLWDPQTGRAVGEPLRHESSVYAVAFNRDRQPLVAGDVYGVRFWDPISGEQVGDALTDLGGTVNAVAVSPDGQQVAFAGSTVWLWGPVWNVTTACGLVARYVNASQVETYLPPGQSPRGCDIK